MHPYQLISLSVHQGFEVLDEEIYFCGLKTINLSQLKLESINICLVLFDLVRIFPLWGSGYLAFEKSF